jgi:hypothetical protein
MTQDMEKEPILQMRSDKIIPSHIYDKSFTIKIPVKREWNKGFQPDGKGRLIWYTEGSKTKKALELGCIATEQGRNLVLALGNTEQYSRQKHTPLRHVQSRI